LWLTPIPFGFVAPKLALVRNFHVVILKLFLLGKRTTNSSGKISKNQEKILLEQGARYSSREKYFKKSKKNKKIFTKIETSL
jgi:hypothetical protein